MAIESVAGGMSALTAFGAIGVAGVGSQWLAWRLRMPSIVVMLVVGLLIGPVFGLLDPTEVIGPVTSAMISVAVAVILFEGGLTLNFHQLGETRWGVRRLVYFGAPIGWLLSALALHYIAGRSWAVSAVFGGIMVVTGPTVIAPLLRQARLSKQPAALLQWEAIVNDPIGALAAVFAFETVVATRTNLPLYQALIESGVGILVGTIVGLLAGRGVVSAFRRYLVPEYMKVSAMFAVMLAAFALSEMALHEAGLLAVTVMGLIIANANLPSYDEIYRFKEHATTLLVSGVFIILTASLDMRTLADFDWRAIAFVIAAILIVRPVTVLLALSFSQVPWAERLLVASTGPRGVVLVAVGGLFGTKLANLGVVDGEKVLPTAFLLVAATVVLHGFTLKKVAQRLGLAGNTAPGMLIVGASRFSVALAEELSRWSIPVMIADTNHGKLAPARHAGLSTFYGDVLAEAAEERLDLISYATLIATSDNDAYNTLVAINFAPEYGRQHIWQIGRASDNKARHALPAQLIGRAFADGLTYDEIEQRMQSGWGVNSRRFTDSFTYADWRKRRPEAIPLLGIGPKGELRPFRERTFPADYRLVSLQPPAAAIDAACDESATPAD